MARLRSRYKVLVIGSGYGGAILASRMSRAGQKVCLLERGKEIRSGDYPQEPKEALREMQAQGQGHHIGSPSALYDFHLNDDLDVFVGCGLGGTSLVNANVSLPAAREVFDDPRWPREIAADCDTVLKRGYERATAMLKPQPYPEGQPVLKKHQAHRKSAEHIGEAFRKTPINVTFEDGVNDVGVEQKACNGCGDCVTGCNYSAKNTTLMNYLPDAFNHGAEIFTEAEVSHLEYDEAAKEWITYFFWLGTGREKFDAHEGGHHDKLDSPMLSVRSELVFLGAGSLGSTGILMRSRNRGLKVSDKLGAGFTGNGDFLGFAYNCDEPINGVGFGKNAPGKREPVDPCITSVIDTRDSRGIEDEMVIEEGSLPGPIGEILSDALALSAKGGEDTDWSLKDEIREFWRRMTSFVRGPYNGAVRNTQTFLVMAHEGTSGDLRLDSEDGYHVRVDWPQVGTSPIFEQISRILRKCTEPLGGKYVANPIWHKDLGNKLVTVHPLGGCCMGADAASGAVNHKGQVFSSSEGAAVHESLYVCDGAIVPRSLGVNPLLTISALSERCAEYVASDHCWSYDVVLPSAPPPEDPGAGKLGIRFTERMTGYFSTAEKEDYKQAYEEAKLRNDFCRFTLEVSSDDLDTLLEEPEHAPTLSGTATCPPLDQESLVVHEGVFQLLTNRDSEVNTRELRYRMKLRSPSGKGYYFEGFKTIRDDRILVPEIWPDTTTLYVTIHDGDDAAAPVLGKGILKIKPRDFLTQMTTLEVVNAGSWSERVTAISRFGKYFAGSLYQTYGGVALPNRTFDPNAEPRMKRPLRAGAPEVYPVTTEDGVMIQLTRFRGGEKGPVMLSHGLGVSSTIFRIDTIETNLVEFLYAAGYDVWCLDFRLSIDLPAANEQSTGDDVATKDYPAAVAKIRELTGADSIQAVVHCFGSTTFFMAMLAGLEGISSVVCSQIALHVDVDETEVRPVSA